MTNASPPDDAPPRPPAGSPRRVFFVRMDQPRQSQGPHWKGMPAILPAGAPDTGSTSQTPPSPGETTSSGTAASAFPTTPANPPVPGNPLPIAASGQAAIDGTAGVSEAIAATGMATATGMAPGSTTANSSKTDSSNLNSANAGTSGAGTSGDDSIQAQARQILAHLKARLRDLQRRQREIERQTADMAARRAELASAELASAEHASAQLASAESSPNEPRSAPQRPSQPRPAPQQAVQPRATQLPATQLPATQLPWAPPSPRLSRHAPPIETSVDQTLSKQSPFPAAVFNPSASRQASVELAAGKRGEPVDDGTQLDSRLPTRPHFPRDDRPNTRRVLPSGDGLGPGAVESSDQGRWNPGRSRAERLAQPRPRQGDSPSGPDIIPVAESEREADLRRREGELTALSERLRERELSLDRQRDALNHLKSEVADRHQETLEMRLACEQLWSQLASRMEAPLLVESLAKLRRRLADQYHNAAVELAQRRDEAREWVARLDERQRDLRRQRDEIQSWIYRRHEELEIERLKLLRREQELDARERAQQVQQAEKQRKLGEYQRQIRQLTAQLRCKSELDRLTS